MWYGVPAVQIHNLNELNQRLFTLTPSISGLSLSQLETRGANLAMLNAVILANATTVYSGMKRKEILDALRGPLATQVNAHPILYAYDAHGDKHFPGGPAGTKFNAAAAVAATKVAINALLVARIAPLIGRIRRDANGKNATYYLTGPQEPWSTNATDLTIQVDYNANPETIGYHGYPDNLPGHVHRLSRTKEGHEIPI